MSRYIDADKLVEKAESVLDEHKTMWLDAVSVNNIYSQPSIDIVHCPNCKFCSERGGHANCNGYLYCTRQKMLVDESCFCSWGEEK